MLIQIAAAAGVLALLTVLPGPDMAVTTRHAVAGGRRGGALAVLGIGVGLLVWGALTVAGLAALLAASATAFTVVKILGAAYLLFLGVQALLRSGGAPGQHATRVGRPFRTGLLTNLLNPKIAVFYTGLLPTLAPSGLSPHVGMALLVLLHCAISLVWLNGYVLLLSGATTALARPKVRRAIERVTGIVLVGLGVKVALTSQH